MVNSENKIRTDDNTGNTIGDLVNIETGVYTGDLARGNIAWKKSRSYRFFIMGYIVFWVIVLILLGTTNIGNNNEFALGFGIIVSLSIFFGFYFAKKISRKYPEEYTNELQNQFSRMNKPVSFKLIIRGCLIALVFLFLLSIIQTIIKG